MGYVGNEPSVNFTSFAKQDITGDGGASYTLTHAVANANEIEVFVNNVRQEPTEAYTVSGTALTMTGNVASTDDFYVIYLGKALQTTTPPDGSVSTAKIADDAVTSAKLDTNIAIDGDLTVDTSTLKVDSTNNRVGIGTASPTTNLEVESSGDTTLSITAGGTSNDSKIDFVQGSTTDGGITYDHNGAYASEQMVFRTGNNTPNMRLTGDGILLMKKTSDSLNNTTGISLNGAAGLIRVERDNDPSLQLNRLNADGQIIQFFRGSTNQVGNITGNVSSTSYNTSSDHRLKENVTADWDATTRLKQLNPVRFNFIADADTTVDGFLAHEVQSVVPEAITGTHNEVDADGNPVYQGIDQSKLVPLLVKTIQELEARITALENA